VLQGMIDRLIDTGRCCGMEMNVKKTKVKGISRQPSSLQVITDQKQQQENVECIRCLGSMINGAHCTWEIEDFHGKSSIQNEDSLHQQIGLKFKGEVNMRHRLVWCCKLYTSGSRS